MTELDVRRADGYVCDMAFRMPFHFGKTTVYELPHLFVEVEIEVDGERETGLAAEGLSPLWFLKGADFVPGLEAMVEVVEAALSGAEEAPPADSPFACWHDLHERQRRWAGDEYPPLLWGFGPTTVERAVVDAFCRLRGTTFPEALRADALGLDLGAVHPELDGRAPSEFLPGESRETLTVRHTVGFTDPLVPADVDDPLDDGLPQALSTYVERQGLTHFKVKVSGEPEPDRERLADLADLLAGRDAVVTIDANEGYPDAPTFRDRWRALEDDPDVAPLLKDVVYVEQPLARDSALTDEARETFEEWEGPPLIIDESDADVDSVRRALECGYAGTTHKNCKGLFRGIANACLLEHRARQGEQTVLSAEDLTTVGPVGLQQDLAAVAALGPTHVERNGHHYFRGLSMLPGSVQEAVLEAHPDLYRRHQEGFATVDVDDGHIEVGSTLDAPFGYACEVDPGRFTPLSEWTFEPGR